MTTPRTLISDCLVEGGVNGATDTMSAKQAQISLRALNRVIDGWQVQKLMLYAITELVATVNGASATIGPGMQFDVPNAPEQLARGCYYVRSGLSYPLDVWERDAYNAVVQKALSGEFPCGVYLDRGAGVVRFWPVPSSGPQYHLQVAQRLTAFTSLDDDHTFPDGYENALYTSLLEVLPPLFQMPVPANAPERAKAARRALKTTNSVAPVLQIDVPGSGSGRFNIYAGMRTP